MTTDIDVEAAPSLATVALELKALARAMPRWDPFEAEDWDAFRVRRLRAERALAARLVRLPGCALVLSDDGWEVDLTLAGVRVRSRDRLYGACVAWASEAAGRPVAPGG